MEKDYIEFMSKMLDKGHAGLVPDGEISCNKSQGEYGTYLTSTRIIRKNQTRSESSSIPPQNTKANLLIVSC